MLGVRLVVLHFYRPLCVGDQCAPEVSGVYLTVSGGSNITVRV